MTKRFIKLSFVLAVFIALIINNIYAQEIKDTNENNTQIKYQDITEITKLVDKSEKIKNYKNFLSSRIKELTELSDIEKRFNNDKDTFYDKNKDYKDKTVDKNTDIFSIIELKQEVKTITDDCVNLQDEVLKKINDLNKLKKNWSSIKEEWYWLQESGSLANTSHAKEVFNDIKRDRYIEDSDSLLENVDKPLVNIDNQISQLKKETNRLVKDLDKLIVDLQKRLFHKSQHAMFSTKYFNDIKNYLNQKTVSNKTSKDNFKELFDSNGWLFIIQILVFIIALLYLKNVKEDFLEDIGLNFLHKNYICSSIIISVLVGIPFFFENFPISIKLTYTILLCIAAGIIICEKISNKSVRAGIALVFILYILYKIFDLANISDIVSRLVLTFVSLIAGIYFFYFAKINNFIYSYYNKNNDTFISESNIKIKLFNIILGIFFILAFILQIAGYTSLANHIFHITLKSVLIVLLAWILLGFLKGCVKSALTNLFVDKYLRSIIPDTSLIINNCNTVITLLVMFFVLASILTAWGFYDNIIESSKSILTLGFTIHGLKITFGNLCLAIFLFCLILSISWLVRSILDVNFYPKRNIESGVAISINRLIYYSFIVVAIAVAMGVLGISIQSLMVVIGALGVGIGFGLQNIVNNFASGLILLFERSIKVGDIIVVNGTWGTVKHLGLRATIIQTFANAEMIVPNSDLVSGTVNNWTMTNRQTRFTVKVGVAYGTDTALVKNVLLKIASNNSNVLKDPAPSVVFTEFGDSSLNFELRCWVKEINIMWKTQDEIMYEVDREFKNNNISIPFPQRDLYIKEMPSSMKEVSNDNKTPVYEEENSDNYKPSIFPESNNNDNEENREDNNESESDFKNKKKDKFKHKR